MTGGNITSLVQQRLGQLGHYLRGRPGWLSRRKQRRPAASIYQASLDDHGGPEQPPRAWSTRVAYSATRLRARTRKFVRTGNVTGRTYKGGLGGYLDCESPAVFVLNHGIYRGEAQRREPPAAQGWAGVDGGANTCYGHVRSSSFGTSPVTDAVDGLLFQDLRSPCRLGPARTKGYKTGTELKSPRRSPVACTIIRRQHLSCRTIWNARARLPEYHVLQSGDAWWPEHPSLGREGKTALLSPSYQR